MPVGIFVHQLKVILMQVEINPDMTIGALNERFGAAFPFLRLMFFHRSPETDFRHSLDMYAPDKLSKYLREGKSGKFILDPAHSTAETERKFDAMYHLHVQVARKSRKAWLITTTTDHYSLADQNRIGQEMAASFSPAEPMDIHEQE